MKNTSKVFVVILLLAAAGWPGFSGGGEWRPKLSCPKGDVIRAVEKTGRSRLLTQENFRCPTCQVSSVEVEAGDLVKKGQVLVRMQNADLGVRISETRTQINQAARDLEGQGPGSRKAGSSWPTPTGTATGWDACTKPGRRPCRPGAGAAGLQPREGGTRRFPFRLCIGRGALRGLEKDTGELTQKPGSLSRKARWRGLSWNCLRRWKRSSCPATWSFRSARKGKWKSPQISSAMRSRSRRRAGSPRDGPDSRARSLREGSKKSIRGLKKSSPPWVVLQRRVEVKVSLPYNPKLKPWFEVWVPSRRPGARTCCFSPWSPFVRPGRGGDRLPGPGRAVRLTPVRWVSAIAGCGGRERSF